MTITLCIDRDVNWKPGKHVVRDWHDRRRLRTARAWWLWFAVAWYAYDDRELVTTPHEWDDSP